MNDRNAYDLRAKYTRFRILVIGRANAGKTTLLQRVCNTIDDPCIYDENNKNLLEPTSARGKHDINRPFAFRSNPGFIFHDSPGFESGDEKQLEEVLSFMERKAKANDVDDQLHAIWFCLVLNNARPLLPLEAKFFQTTRAVKVPVIAIFTKFDDLMTQIYDLNDDDDVNRRNAEQQVEKMFRKPLYQYTFPPRADVCFEGLHTTETDRHQDQVKVLIERTASSLDDDSLKMLFISVQRNNIELSIQYAIADLTGKIGVISTLDMTWRTMLWFGHSFIRGYIYDKSDAKERRREKRHKQYYQAYTRRGDFDAYTLSVFLNAKTKSSRSLASFFLTRKSCLGIFTALLICMENTFWNISRSDDFVDLFKTSFALYVQSGRRKKIADILGNELDGSLVTQDFKTKLFNTIIEHYLPRPGESHSGDQTLALEQSDERKFIWLKNMMLKIHRGKKV